MDEFPKFTVITPTGMARAVIEGYHTALRVQDYFTQQDMIPHTIRPTREGDARPDVLTNT